MGGPARRGCTRSQTSSIVKATNQMRVRLFEEVWALAEKCGDRDRAALVLNDLLWAMKNLGDYELALDYAQQARAIATETGNERAIASSWSYEGLAASERGDQTRARAARMSGRWSSSGVQGTRTMRPQL